MGRASRRRAEQRADSRAQPPSTHVPADQPHRHERVWEALAAGPPRRTPFRRPPDGAASRLVRLQELCDSRHELDAAIATEVGALAALGTDWGTIGRTLGVSRQAARQRYSTALQG